MIIFLLVFSYIQFHQVKNILILELGVKFKNST